MLQNLERKSIKSKIFLFCIVLGILFTFLFYNQSLGINYFIFIVALLSAFVWLCITCKAELNFNYYLSIVLILIYSFAYASIGNILIQVINFIIVPIILLYFTIKTFLNKMVIDSLIVQLGGSLEKIYLFTKTIFTGFNVKELNPKSKGIFIGIVISLGLLVVIIPLMGSADKVFGYFIGNIFSRLEDISILEYLIQFIIFFTVSSFLYGYVYQLNNTIKRNNEINEKNIAPKKEALKNTNSLQTANLTILVFINIVYFIFSFIQFNYLFLGNMSNIPDFSYSQYARSGFFQMLVLSLINFCIIMLSRYLIKNDEKNIKSISNILMSLLVFFNYILITSSFYRMHLYESTYGFTVLRLCVYLILIWETLIMLIILAGIWKRNTPIIKMIIYTSLVFYCVVNLLNMDAFIAKKNVDRYFDRGVIDVYYLSNLSYDAYPEIERLLNSDNNLINKEVLKIFNESNLNNRSYSWKEYNLSRSKAIKIINKY